MSVLGVGGGWSSNQGISAVLSTGTLEQVEAKGPGRPSQEGLGAASGGDYRSQVRDSVDL